MNPVQVQAIIQPRVKRTRKDYRNYREWTAEEQARLLDLTAKVGRNFFLLKVYFPGREAWELRNCHRRLMNTRLKGDYPNIPRKNKFSDEEANRIAFDYFTEMTDYFYGRDEALTHMYNEIFFTEFDNS